MLVQQMRLLRRSWTCLHPYANTYASKMLAQRIGFKEDPVNVVERSQKVVGSSSAVGIKPLTSSCNTSGQLIESSWKVSGRVPGNVLGWCLRLRCRAVASNSEDLDYVQSASPLPRPSALLPFHFPTLDPGQRILVPIVIILICEGSSHG